MALLTRLVLSRSCIDLSRSLTRPAFAHLSSSSRASASSPRAEEKTKKPIYREGFTCIYQFRYIVPLRIVNRFKIYQTVFSVLTGLGSLAAYASHCFDDLQFVAILNGSMWLALFMLLLISRNSVRVVGAIYLDDATKTQALISHLDFLAKRRDFVVDLNKVHTIDTADELKELYLKVKLQDAEGFMFLFHKHGFVHDAKGLRKFLKLD